MSIENQVNVQELHRLNEMLAMTVDALCRIAPQIASVLQSAPMSPMSPMAPMSMDPWHQTYGTPAFHPQFQTPFQPPFHPQFQTPFHPHFQTSWMTAPQAFTPMGTPVMDPMTAQHLQTKIGTLRTLIGQQSQAPSYGWSGNGSPYGFTPMTPYWPTTQPTVGAPQRLF